MRVATYSRVSTERDQNPEAQKQELRRYCEARGWALIEEIADHGYSGGSYERPGLKALLALVRARKVDVVVVTKLDRLFRSLRHLVTILDELESLGVKFVSLFDQIDMTSASGRLMLHLIAAFAEFERALVRERTLLGLEHARRQGKRLGRPKRRNDAEILSLRAQGLSYRQIQRKLGVTAGTVSRALKGAPQSPQKSLVTDPGESGGCDG